MLRFLTFITHYIIVSIVLISLAFSPLVYTQTAHGEARKGDIERQALTKYTPTGIYYIDIPINFSSAQAKSYELYAVLANYLVANDLAYILEVQDQGVRIGSPKLSSAQEFRDLFKAYENSIPSNYSHPDYSPFYTLPDIPNESDTPIAPVTPTLSVIPSNKNISATDAGNSAFNVANIGSGTMNWTASVTSGSSWLSISSGASGVNNELITVQHSQNNDPSPRTAEITVIALGATGSSKIVTITQAGSAITSPAQPNPSPQPMPQPQPSPSPLPKKSFTPLTTISPQQLGDLILTLYEPTEKYFIVLPISFYDYSPKSFEISSSIAEFFINLGAPVSNTTNQESLGNGGTRGVQGIRDMSYSYLVTVPENYNLPALQLFLIGIPNISEKDFTPLPQSMSDSNPVPSPQPQPSPSPTPKLPVHTPLFSEEQKQIGPLPSNESQPLFSPNDSQQNINQQIAPPQINPLNPQAQPQSSPLPNQSQTPANVEPQKQQTNVSSSPIHNVQPANSNPGMGVVEIIYGVAGSPVQLVFGAIQTVYNVVSNPIDSVKGIIRPVVDIPKNSYSLAKDFYRDPFGTVNEIKDGFNMWAGDYNIWTGEKFKEVYSQPSIYEQGKAITRVLGFDRLAGNLIVGKAIGLGAKKLGSLVNVAERGKVTGDTTKVAEVGAVSGETGLFGKVFGGIGEKIGKVFFKSGDETATAVKVIQYSTKFTEWINLGPKNVSVYIGYKDGKAVYVGISNNVVKREAQHLAGKLDYVRPINAGPFTRNQARAIEQNIINANKIEFDENAINSIAEGRDIYDEALKYGSDLMNQHGIKLTGY